LNFTIDLEAPMSDPRLGFSVWRLDGTQVVGHTIPLPGPHNRGRYMRSYQVPATPLVAGRYRVGTWFADTNGVELDSCTAALEIEVITPRGGSAESGSITLAGQWL
jgi:hypothetical protein